MRRLGLSLPLERVPLAAQADWLRRCEDLGYTDFWSSEVAGLDAFSPLAAAAPVTRAARLGTAIAGILQRGPGLLAMSAAALCEAAPGRFALGIGTSSPAIVEGWNARRFDRPWSRTRDTLRFLRRALAGERVDEEYETFRVQGFRLERRAFPAPPILLAALGPRMLRLAGAEADGVALGLLAAEDVPRVLAEAKSARRPDRSFEVVLRLGVYPTSDRERAERPIRRLLAAYLCSPAYAQLHARLGRAEQLRSLQEAWRRGDRRGALAAVPGDLVDRLFVHGPPERCRDRLVEFMEAGVTTPVVAVAADDLPSPGVLKTLAGALR